MGYILPDKKAYISSSVLDWYPLFKRTDQTGPGNWGWRWREGGVFFLPHSPIPRRVLVLGAFINKLHTQSGVRVEGRVLVGY
jgi:hypothetical protein